MTTAIVPGFEVSHTLLALCPVCASDDCEPAGITGRMDDSRDAVVVMRCSHCSLVYLSPDRNTLGQSPPSLPAAALRRRRIRQWTAGLPPSARILVADCSAGKLLRPFAKHSKPAWVLEGTERDTQALQDGRAAGFSLKRGSIGEISPESGPYDLLVLPHSLESAKRPDALLAHVAALLSPGGRVIAITSNVGSSCFRTFGGRHWSGYCYPHTRQFLSANAIRQLCDEAGLSVRAVSTRLASEHWLFSLANWLRDWGAPEGLIGIATGRWLVPKAIALTIEGFSVLRNRGSLLVVELQKP